MKKLDLAVYVWFIAATLAGCSTPPMDPEPDVDSTPAGQMAGLTFLEGNWAGPSPKGVWEAHYTSPAGGTVLGMSKDQLTDGTSFSEFERIGIHDGKVVIWPYPNGEKRDPFALVELDRDNRIVAFENPANDFPQRFEYWRVDEETLVIKVTNLKKVDGKFPGFILKLSRSN